MTLFPVASPNGLKRRRGRRASNDVAAYHTLTAALKAFSFIPVTGFKHAGRLYAIIAIRLVINILLHPIKSLKWFYVWYHYPC